MVRALHRSIFGRNCGASFCSIRVQAIPRRPRSMASVNPVGPAPTIRTGVFMRGGFERFAEGLAPRDGIMEERVSPPGAKHYVAGDLRISRRWNVLNRYSSPAP